MRGGLVYVTAFIVGLIINSPSYSQDDEPNNSLNINTGQLSGYMAQLRDALSVVRQKNINGQINNSDQLNRLAYLLEEGRVLTQNVAAYTFVQKTVDLQTIVDLVSLVDTNNRALRINATLLLANITDNTTICAVINKLKEGAVNGHLSTLDTEFNLLQLLNAVARFTSADIRKWINVTLDDLRPSLAQPNMAESASVAQRIAANVNSSSPLSTTLYDYNQRRFLQCRRLSFVNQLPLIDDVDKALKGDRAKYRLFLHTNWDAGRIAAIIAALSASGYNVTGPDNVQLANGIVYSLAANQEEQARDIADVVNGKIAAPLSVNADAAAQPGYFSVTIRDQ